MHMVAKSPSSVAIVLQKQMQNLTLYGTAVISPLVCNGHAFRSETSN